MFLSRGLSACPASHIAPGISPLSLEGQVRSWGTSLGMRQTRDSLLPYRPPQPTCSHLASKQGCTSEGLTAPRPFLEKRGCGCVLSRLPNRCLGWAAMPPRGHRESHPHPNPAPGRDRSLPFPASLPRRAAWAGRGARRLWRGRGGLLGSLARIKYLLCFVWPLGEGQGGLSHRSGAAGPGKGRGRCQAPRPEVMLP